MEIYLIEQGKEPLILPVNPKEINIKRTKLYETINIMNLGEVDFTHGDKVREITFSSFFPAEYDASYCNRSVIPDPQQAMNQLTAWNVSEKPIRLIITETIVDVLVLVSVHNSTFKGGEPGDVYYDLTLRTWREMKVRTQAEAAAGNAATSRADLQPVAATYTVKTGDSLWRIAQLQLGDGSRWPEIYELNKEAIGNKPELIYAGTELVMPT